MAGKNGIVAILSPTGDSRSGAQGMGGPINLNLNGSITATGQDAVAIYAQSGIQRTDGLADGEVISNPIQIEYSGILTSGSGQGAAIVIDGGQNNIITLLSGTISAQSGMAIIGGQQTETINNSATLIGSLDLNRNGGQPDQINNTGTLLPGPIITLGEQ